MTELIHETPFYFATIEKITAAVGTVFNNISIVRTNSDGTQGQRFKVKLVYGSKQHWFYRKDGNIAYSEESLENGGHGVGSSGITLPRISYSLTGMAYDPSRKLNSLNKIKMEVKEKRTGEKTRINQFVPVPFTLNFTVSILTKNMVDGLQIIEQFLPYFNPIVNLKILEIRETNTWNDVSIAIVGQSFTDRFEEGFTEKNLKEWTFELAVKANLYPPVKEQKVILTSIVDIDNLAPLHDIEIITVAANPGELSDKDNSTTTIEINEPGS